MNALIKYVKHPFIIPALVNIVILGNLILWLVAPALTVFASFTIFILIFLIIARLIDIKSNYLLIVFLSYALFLTLGLGTAEWDSRTIWLAHAKVIYLDQDLYAQFLDGGYIGGHVDYPIGFPALAATLANAVGIWNEVFPKAVLIFFLMPPLFLTFQILQSKVLEILFLVGLAVICRSYLFNGYMDALVALYAWSIVLLTMQTKSAKKELPHDKLSGHNYLFAITLASFFGVLLMLKNEGLAITILLFICLFLCRLPFTYLKIFMIGAIPLAFYLLIWKAPLWKYGVSNHLISSGILDRIFLRATNLENIELIAGYFFRYCDLFTLVFVLNFFRKSVLLRDFRLPILFVISYAALLFVIYLSTPYDLNWHLVTSIKRTLLPILLVMFGSIVFSFSPAYIAHGGKN